MTITASLVKDLRERTGVGMMECRPSVRVSLLLFPFQTIRADFPFSPTSIMRGPL